MESIEDIKAWVKDIKESIGDNENAHELEDDLYITVLTGIANGECSSPAKYAKEALKAHELNYERWYA